VLLQIEVLGGENHSVELLLLISLPAFLNDNLHRKMLNELESETLKSITLSVSLHGGEKFVSLCISLGKLFESTLGMLNL